MQRGWKICECICACLVAAGSLFGQRSNTVTITDNGAPVGSCAVIFRYVDALNGDLYACNPATDTWVKIGPGGGGGVLTQIDPGANVGPTVTFQVGTTGTDFNLSNPAANQVRYNLPTASALNRGALSTADWTAFNAKQPVLSTHAAVANNFLTGFTAPNTFTAAQPAYSGLSGLPTLPANEAGAANNFLTAYNSGTGAFSKAQPSCGNLSDSGTGCSGAAYPGFPRLDEIIDPTADKTFANSTYDLTFAGTGDYLSNFATHQIGAPFSSLSAYAQSLLPVGTWRNMFVGSSYGGGVTTGINVIAESPNDSAGTEGIGLYALINTGNSFGRSVIGINLSSTTEGTGLVPPSGAIGYQSYIEHGANGAMSQAIGFYASENYISGAGSIVTNYGLKVDNQTVGATNYAIKTGLGQVDFGDTVKGASTINAVTGFQVNSAAALANVLRGNGTNFVSAALSCADLSDEGTGCTGAAYPGLVAHNILSASHGDTTPAAAVRGDMIAAIGASPLWARVAHSATTGGYWKWNGTDVVASTGAAGGTGACTNQAVTAENADSAPTCTTLTSAYTSGTFPATAHDILSATHGDTTAAAVVRGDLMTGQGASPKWVRLAKGGASECLQMDGTATDILWGACSAGGFPRLDQVLDPTADKTFDMATFDLQFLANDTLFTVGPLAGFVGGYDYTSLARTMVTELNPTYAPADTAETFLVQLENSSAVHLNRAAHVVANSTSAGVAAPGGVRGLEVEAYYTGAGTQTDVGGLAVTAEVDSGTSTTMRALDLFVGNYGASNTQVQGIRLQVDASSGSDDAVGIDLDSFDAGGGASAIGIRISDINTGTANYAIKTGLGQVDFGDTVKGASTINAVTGFQVNGAATLANVLRGNGTNFVDAALSCADLSDEGTGCTGAAYPGLATHKLLSVTHTGTTAADPVRGDIIYADSTPSWTKLALGAATAGKYAKSNGTDVVISTGSASGTGACGAGDFVTGVNADSAPTCATPASGGTTLSVNGSALAATTGDLDDATPAAPANGFNIKWQKDALTPTNISAYLDAATLVTATYGSGSAITQTFDVGAVDPVIAFTTGNIKYSGATTYTFEGGATDPIWTPGNSIMNLSTGTLQQGGSAVATAGNNLSFFSATTSAQLYGVLSDETGSATGAPLAVFNQTPTIATPSFTTGFTIGGVAASGAKLIGNGTNFVSGTPNGAQVGSVFVSKTFTNIGNAYVDVYVTAFDSEDMMRIDFTGVTEVRAVWMWDYVGAGTQNVRWADAADNANVLITSANMLADCDACDTGWVALPAAFVGTTKTLEFQGKSTTAADDPIAKGYVLFVR